MTGARRTYGKDVFWERLLRDEEDGSKHMDYIHYNPVKHGYVRSPEDWPQSSFGEMLKEGLYAPGWGTKEPGNISRMNLQ